MTLPEPDSPHLVEAIRHRYLHDAEFHARCDVAWRYAAQPEHFPAGTDARLVRAAIVTALYIDDEHRRRTQADRQIRDERRMGRIGVEEALTDAASDAVFYGDGFVRAKRFQDGSLLWERVDPAKVILAAKEEPT